MVLLSPTARCRYGDDIVRALVHPAGTEFCFRYGEKYLEPNLVARYEHTRAVNLAGLICHLATPDSAKSLLVPCGFVTVIRVQKIGTLLRLHSEGRTRSQIQFWTGR